LQAAARLFHRLGAWEDAIDAGEKALRVVGGFEAEALAQEGRWTEHPLPWLTQAESSAGRFAAARQRLVEAQQRLELIEASSDAMASWRLRSVLEISWSRLRRLEFDWPVAPRSCDWPVEDFGVVAGSPPGHEPLSTSDRLLASEAQAGRAWVEGLLAARAAWPRAEPERVSAARAAIATLERLAVAHPVPPRFELLRTEVQAALSAALEARDELALFEAHLAGLGQRLRDTADEVGGSSGSDGICGDLHMQLRDWFEASRCYAAAAAAPRRARVLLGEARARRRLGQDARARRQAMAFLDVWASADETRPELADARGLAAGQ
jgi:tetratricopeptide (TPR) repeat protein